MAENKEIDIIGLLINVFAFIKRYAIIILIFLVVGVGVGALKFYTGRNYFKTTLVATSPVVDDQIVYELMGPVKYYIGNEMFDSISEKFNISVEIAKDIHSIDLDTNLVEAVKIDLQVYNVDNVSIIQQGLMYYLNNIPYIASSIDNRRVELDSYIKEINLEIVDLNNMQEAILNNIQDGEGAKWVSSGNMFSEMMALNDRKLELITEYNSLAYFKVINTNMVFESQTSLKKSVFIFAAISLLLGIIVSVVVEIIRLIKIRRKE